MEHCKVHNTKAGLFQSLLFHLTLGWHLSVPLCSDRFTGRCGNGSLNIQHMLPQGATVTRGYSKNDWNLSPVARGQISRVRQLSFQHDTPSQRHSILHPSVHHRSAKKNQQTPTLLRNASLVTSEHLKTMSTVLRYLPQAWESVWVWRVTTRTKLLQYEEPY